MEQHSYTVWLDDGARGVSFHAVDGYRPQTLKRLELIGGRYGLFSSCCGGGHGTTTVIENLRR